MKRILLDTNIFISAVDRSSIHHIQAQQYIQKVQKNCVVTQQNIMEFLRVTTHQKFPHPMTPKTALKAIDSIVAPLRILSPRPETYDVVMLLIQKYKVHGNHIFDIYLVATMLSYGIYDIATYNTKHFSFFEEIRVIDFK